MLSQNRPKKSNRGPGEFLARAIGAMLLVASLCWMGALAARIANGGLPGTIRAAGTAGRMVFSGRAEAAVEIRGRRLVLWWKESPVPLSQEQARDLARLLAPREPATAATLVAGEWSFHAPGPTGAFRLARRINDAARIEYAITGADAAEIARLLSVAGGGG